ncbi:hypothetical protein ACFQJD_16990 [Haloplanus sp. GCM10025708]|uniref:DUF7473 family protein n=1 Tax=Haloferacaceae TaxID=1644056 RepID=UPI003609A732
MVVLQTASNTPLAVAGTAALLALFLSITAHLAARNVLGDVPVRKAFVVGPVPAAIAVVSTAFDVHPYLAIAVALTADGALIGYLYGESRRMTAYVTLIHAVVSVLLGSVLVSLYLLALSAPS